MFQLGGDPRWECDERRSIENIFGFGEKRKMNELLVIDGKKLRRTDVDK